MNRYWSSGAVILILAGAALAADTSPSPNDCLFATHAGGIDQRPCADQDPLMLRVNTKIGLARHALGISASHITFRGCVGQPFKTYVDSNTKNGDRNYVITYPSETEDPYLAPIVHELAHVMQLEVAGGSKEAVRGARQNTSLRVELEADYLTGMVFSQALKSDGTAAFQHSQIFAGMFKEMESDAHGTPSQRNSAFRQGYFQPIGDDMPDIKTAANHFQANVYGDLALSH